MSCDLVIKNDLPIFNENANTNSDVSLWNLYNQALLPELNNIIVKELNRVDLEDCLISREWYQLSKDPILRLREFAFGSKEWSKLGITVKEPRLPLNIFEILDRQCPFSEAGIRIKDSHSLVLLPGELNGEPVGFRNLGELIKGQFPSLGEDGYMYLKRHAETRDGIRSPRWVLIKKSGFAENESSLKQKELVTEKGGGEYIIPRAVDTLACAIAEYSRSKINILKNGPKVVRAAESENGPNIVLGGKNGFYVSNSDWGDENVSVLPLMELKWRS